MGGIGLLDKFQIQTGHISNYYIIAVDPGAGEWSATVVVLKGSKIKGVRDLYVLNDGRTCKDYSVLYYNQKADTWEIGQRAARLAENDEENNKFFENFKVVPGSPVATECYGLNYENPTMEELMVKNFQCIIKRLFVDGNNGLEGKKLIFFVGRPASTDWAQAEVMYRDMLYKALKIEGVKKSNIQMAMVSEAQAALAAEIYGEGLDLNPGALQVVFDVGSSTLDATVIKDGKVIGEYSRQIGAGVIEANMLEISFYDDCDAEGVSVNRLEKYFAGDEKYQQTVSYRRKLRKKLCKSPYIREDKPEEFKFSKIKKFYERLDGNAALTRFELRVQKEIFFGEDGKSGSGKGSKELGINGEYDTLKINNETMEKAIYRMPIFVPCTESSERDNLYKSSYIYRSYYDALEHFIDGVREMYLAGGQTPDVILTGGASVMPFVGQLIQKKWNVEPRNSVQPSYTVSRGLAYIGYTEMKKQEELAAINKIIADKFEEKMGSLSSKICKSFSKWYMDEWMNDFLQWKTSGSSVSLNEALSKKHCYDSGKIGEMDVVKKWWIDEVEPDIVSAVKERFEKLYKNTYIQYDFKINPQIVENAYREGGTTIIHYAWSDAIGLGSAIWLNPDRKDYDSARRGKLYDKAEKRKDTMAGKISRQDSVVELGNKHAKEIQDGFKEELYKDVVTYVEGLTPYMVRQ